MNNKQFSYNVTNLNNSLEFYKSILNAQVKSIHSNNKSADLLVYGVELNLNEDQLLQKNINKKNACGESIKFPLKDPFKVNEVYRRAHHSKVKYTIKPDQRMFGQEYVLQIQDPDGVCLEVFTSVLN